MYIDPTYEKIQKLEDDKKKNESTLELANELKKKRVELQEKFNSISEEEKESLVKLIPDTVDNVRLILDINNIAEKYGIVIKSIDVTAEVDVSESTTAGESGEPAAGAQYIVSSGSAIDKIGIISLSFSFSSTYDIFLEFMTDLEEALRIVDIRTIGVDVPGEGDFYDYNLEVDTYWLR